MSPWLDYHVCYDGARSGVLEKELERLANAKEPLGWFVDVLESLGELDSLSEGPALKCLDDLTEEAKKASEEGSPYGYEGPYLYAIPEQLWEKVLELLSHPPPPAPLAQRQRQHVRDDDNVVVGTALGSAGVAGDHEWWDPYGVRYGWALWAWGSVGLNPLAPILATSPRRVWKHDTNGPSLTISVESEPLKSTLAQGPAYLLRCLVREAWLLHKREKGLNQEGITLVWGMFVFPLLARSEESVAQPDPAWRAASERELAWALLPLRARIALHLLLVHRSAKNRATILQLVRALMADATWKTNGWGRRRVARELAAAFNPPRQDLGAPKAWSNAQSVGHNELAELTDQEISQWWDRLHAGVFSNAHRAHPAAPGRAGHGLDLEGGLRDTLSTAMNRQKRTLTILRDNLFAAWVR